MLNWWSLFCVPYVTYPSFGAAKGTMCTNEEPCPSPMIDPQELRQYIDANNSDKKLALAEVFLVGRMPFWLDNIFRGVSRMPESDWESDYQWAEDQTGYRPTQPPPTGKIHWYDWFKFWKWEWDKMEPPHPPDRDFRNNEA